VVVKSVQEKSGRAATPTSGRVIYIIWIDLCTRMDFWCTHRVRVNLGLKGWFRPCKYLSQALSLVTPQSVQSSITNLSRHSGFAHVSIGRTSWLVLVKGHKDQIPPGRCAHLSAMHRSVISRRFFAPTLIKQKWIAPERAYKMLSDYWCGRFWRV
jgi:hypothetical protein